MITYLRRVDVGIGKTPKARGRKRIMAIPRYRGRVAAAVARDAWDALKIYSIYRTYHYAANCWKWSRHRDAIEIEARKNKILVTHEYAEPHEYAEETSRNED